MLPGDSANPDAHTTDGERVRLSVATRVALPLLVVVILGMAPWDYTLRDALALAGLSIGVPAHRPSGLLALDLALNSPLNLMAYSLFFLLVALRYPAMRRCAEILAGVSLVLLGVDKVVLDLVQRVGPMGTCCSFPDIYPAGATGFWLFVATGSGIIVAPWRYLVRAVALLAMGAALCVMVIYELHWLTDEVAGLALGAALWQGSRLILARQET